MAPRTIRRRAPRQPRVSRIPQPVSEPTNPKIYQTFAKVEQIYRRFIGPRAYPMNVVERVLLPRPEGMGIPPRSRTQSGDVLRRYIQMMRRINEQPLHPNAESHSPPPHQHRPPRANSVASNEGQIAQLQDALVEVSVNSPATVIPPNLVHHEDAHLEDLAITDDAEDLAVDDYAEDLAAIDGAIVPPPEPAGSVSPLWSPIVSSDNGYEHDAFMYPEIEHNYYDCPLCLSVQANPTDSNDEFEDYEPNLFR